MKFISILKSILFVTLLNMSFVAKPSFAWTEAALTAADPLVFPPNDFSLENVKLNTSLVYEFVPGSLEWVRIDHQVTVPRARVRLHVPSDEAVIYRGITYIPNHQIVELLVTLLDEPENKIELPNLKKSIAIQFQNTKNFQTRVALDSSCSPYALLLENIQMPSAWATLFCHVVHPISETGYVFRLSVKILWQSTKHDPALSDFALDSRTSEILLEHGENHFRLKAKLAEKFHPLAVSAGFGPYVHNNVVRPFFTLYAGYTLNETIRLSSFSAVPIGDSPHLDQGFYLITEQAKGIDDRLSVYLLLGAHFLEFDTGGKGYVRLSAPQGVELQFRDFLAKRNTATVGMFYYPEINGTSYVNTWARFGWGTGFLEVNYIRWEEAIEAGSYSAKSFGISYGMPLFRAL